MRFKPVPPAPNGLDAVRTARRGIPLVPAPETDCCTRIANRLGCSRDEARQWVTMLRALDLAEERPSGIVRSSGKIDADHLRERFRERVYGARELLDALRAADRPLSIPKIADRTARHHTRWERDRTHDPETAWRERIQRLLGWGVVLGVVERTDRDCFRAPA